jgi:hypothetical protein
MHAFASYKKCFGKIHQPGAEDPLYPRFSELQVLFYTATVLLSPQLPGIFEIHKKGKYFKLQLA